MSDPKDYSVQDSAVKALDRYRENSTIANADQVISEMSELLEIYGNAIVANHDVLGGVLEKTGYKFQGHERQHYLEAKARALMCVGGRMHPKARETRG